MSKYIKVDWKQNSPEYPIIIYSEIDDNSYETRKLEIFSNGDVGYADSKTDINAKTVLSDQPVPDFEEIKKSPEFELFEITKEDFEKVLEEKNENR